MKKVIAIGTADWHLHEFQAFNKENSRIDYGLQAMIWIGMIANQYKVPVLFAGDMFHTPKELTARTLISSYKGLHHTLFRNKVKMIAISGNHDMAEKNTMDYQSISYLELLTIFDDFYLIDRNSILHGEVLYQGIPYMDNEKDFVHYVERFRKKAQEYKKEGLRILMIHTNIPGAKSSEGFEIPESTHIPRHVDKFFKDWDLVLAGHIHHPQWIGSKVLMLGSPIQQNLGDMNRKMGYWLIYSDGTAKFKCLNKYFPCFVKESHHTFKHKDIDYIVPEVVDEIWNDDEPSGNFDVRTSSDKLTERYLKKKGIKDHNKRQALIQILNDAR